MKLEIFTDEVSDAGAVFLNGKLVTVDGSGYFEPLYALADHLGWDSSHEEISPEEFAKKIGSPAEM